MERYAAPFKGVVGNPSSFRATEMILDVSVFRKSWAKRIIPFLVVLVLGYLDYATFYALGYKEIYRYHSRGAAISLWVILGFTEFMIFVYWVLIILIGPGKCEQVKPYTLVKSDGTNSQDAPPYFFCDENGFPFFSLESHSMVLPRSHWLRDVGYMVKKFDHYCVWIASVIGKNNCMQFIKFTVYFLAFFILILVYLSIYVRSNYKRGRIDHNFIVLFILCGFWIPMLSALLFQHLLYISTNRTTFEDLAWTNKIKYDMFLKRKANGRYRGREPRVELGKRYINIRDEDSSRYVVTFSVSEMPFNMGWRQNWINFAFNGNKNHGYDVNHNNPLRLICIPFILLIPFLDLMFMNRGNDDTDIVESDIISPCFHTKILKKIKKGNYLVPDYLGHTSKPQLLSGADEFSQVTTSSQC